MVVIVYHVYSSVRLQKDWESLFNSKLKDAVHTLRQHSKKSHAVSYMVIFIQVMSNERQPIDHLFVSAPAQQVGNC